MKKDRICLHFQISLFITSFSIVTLCVFYCIHFVNKFFSRPHLHLTTAVTQYISEMKFYNYYMHLFRVNKIALYISYGFSSTHNI